MAIRFNKLIRPGLSDISARFDADLEVIFKSGNDTMFFMSHKTSDSEAETEAKYISDKHGVQVYMAEWDDNVKSDSNELPDHIMRAIRGSDGFLVNVTAEIAVSMWVGYEIGGAHAMEKSRAKIMYREVSPLPSVVSALSALRSRNELDYWILRHMQ